MSNWILTLSYNNMALTQRAVLSALEQDIPTRVLVVDNCSSDGTREWLDSMPDSRLPHINLATNTGVSHGWNVGLEALFADEQVDHVLVIGNDTFLPAWTYSSLLSYNGPFVTGTAVDDMRLINEPIPAAPLVPEPDFSCFCISRECWQMVGPFDESFVHYCGDCDMHMRAHRAGLHLMKADVRYFHIASSTIRNAASEEKQELETQADRDRATFRAIYGTIPGEPEYMLLLAPDEFGIDRRVES